MKSVKFAFAALVLAGGIVAAFAFTAPAKKAAPKWFQFTGNPALQADVLNPLLYTPFVGTPVDVDPDIKLYAIRVDDVTEVYPSGSGTKTGKPKVDVVGSVLEADILDATGFDLSVPNDITNRAILIP